MSSPRSGPSKGVCACYSDILTANQQFFGERYADAYGPKTRLLAFRRPFPGGVEAAESANTSMVCFWPSFGGHNRARSFRIGPENRACPTLICACFFLDTAGELVRQSPSAVAEDL